MNHLTRRQILRLGAFGTAGAAAVAAGGLVLPRARSQDAPGDPADLLGPFEGYGPLIEDPDGIIDLPAGFSYTILAEEGETMSDGATRPGIPDGMETYDAGGGRLALCMNHEIRVEFDRGIFRPGDRGPGGGCTTVIVNPDDTVEEQFISQSDTRVNCAGGKSPWGTWLTCEEFSSPDPAPDYGDFPGLGETLEAEFPRSGYGFAYDVDPLTGENGPAYPDMGQFFREALVFDPRTGVVYMTEDQPDGLFYRYIPTVPFKPEGLSGGRLEAMRVRPPRGRTDRVRVDWIDLTQFATAADEGLRLLGAQMGATPFVGCEGIAEFGGSIYFDEGEGGASGLGRIWRYRPAQETLELWYESNDRSALQQPDNMRQQPGTGDLIYCEDSNGDIEAIPNKLVIQTASGHVQTFAQDRSGSEFAGSCWAPDGQRLFVNVQQAGLTVSITGPFRQGLAAEREQLASGRPPRGGRRRADADQVARAVRDRGMSPLETEAALALGAAL